MRLDRLCDSMVLATATAVSLISSVALTCDRPEHCVMNTKPYVPVLHLWVGTRCIKRKVLKDTSKVVKDLCKPLFTVECQSVSYWVWS